MKKKFLAFLVPIFGYMLVKLIYFTCKKRFNIDGDVPNEPVVVAFWHGELLMQPFLYNIIRPKHKITVMISEHFDGEIIARLISFFGFESSRGSARKNGAKALLSSIKKMEDGYDVAITPDGPKGPRHSIAEGIVAISKKKKAKIVVFNFQATSYWRFNSWDRFAVPKPFSTITFFVSKPLDIIELDTVNAVAFIRQEMLKNAIF